MKLNIATPVVGSGAGLGALCRGLGRFAECGMDQAITEAFALFPTPEQIRDSSRQVVARRSDHGKA